MLNRITLCGIAVSLCGILTTIITHPKTIEVVLKQIQQAVICDTVDAFIRREGDDKFRQLRIPVCSGEATRLALEDAALQSLKTVWLLELQGGKYTRKAEVDYSTQLRGDHHYELELRPWCKVESAKLLLTLANEKKNHEAGKLVLHNEGVRALQQISGNMIVVSVQGKARLGKSETGNEIIGAINKTCRIREPVFQAADTYAACTQGLWMWTMHLNATTTLLVLDSEGSEVHDNEDALWIGVITSLLSSQTIWVCRSRCYNSDMAYFSKLAYLPTLLSLGVPWEYSGLSLLIRDIGKNPPSQNAMRQIILKEVPNIERLFNMSPLAFRLLELPEVQKGDEPFTVRAWRSRDYRGAIPKLTDQVRDSPYKLTKTGSGKLLARFLQELVTEINSPKVSTPCFQCVVRAVECKNVADDLFATLRDSVSSNFLRPCEFFTANNATLASFQENCSLAPESITILQSNLHDLSGRMLEKVQWTETSDWSPCSQSCGRGTKSRGRKCSTTCAEDCVSAHDAVCTSCTSEFREQEPCNDFPCMCPANAGCPQATINSKVSVACNQLDSQWEDGFAECQCGSRGDWLSTDTTKCTRGRISYLLIVAILWLLCGVFSITRHGFS